MGSGALWSCVVNGTITGLEAFSQAESERLRARKPADFMEQQAANTRARGVYEQTRAGVEAQAIDRKKTQLTRQFRDTMGHNRSMLAAGNVDLATGSAMDVQQGNISLYAQDMAENAYDKLLRLWEGDQAYNSYDAEARNLESQASYIKNTAGTIGTSILMGGWEANKAFLKSYSSAGGLFGGSGG